MHPADARKRDPLQARMRTAYEEAYRDQMRIIAREWGEIERYLLEMRRHARAYMGEPFEGVMARIKSRVFSKR